MSRATAPDVLERLVLSGTPRERGLLHGEAYAEEIAENVETYLEVFDHYGADEATVYDQAAAFVSIIEDEHEAYAEEMRGIAEGSGLSIEDVTVLNARYEVMYGAYAETARGMDGDGHPDGCTGFGAQPEVTIDGHTLLGQNWDWIPPLNIFVMDVRREDAPDMVAMTEMGIVGGKIGVNEHGIGMLLMGLVTGADGEDPIRKPYHVRFREALDAERLDQAIAPFVQSKRACSASVLLGHHSGEMIDLELGPESQGYLYAEDGLLTHANHVEGAVDAESEFEKLLPDTLCRSPRLRRLLARERGSIDVEKAKAALRDHVGHPKSICRHIDETDPEHEQDQSNASFVIDCDERHLYGTYGPPCENDYVGFQVGS